MTPSEKLFNNCAAAIRKLEATKPYEQEYATREAFDEAIRVHNRARRFIEHELTKAYD
jgi:hypothetical protein